MAAAAAATTTDFDMDDYQFPLPGFRFHPTDQELVDYYLRRKVHNKSVTLELIKQIDIYRYNPWDLPYIGGTSGEKECYVFVKRGRKYKNSVRPNRVTGAGFWKATGIDKPIYSQGEQGNGCIGLKKTLVFYKGSAGRGVKTEWMMHEFRLPPSNCSKSHNSHLPKTINNADEEAEIWTLCRIFKRSATCGRYRPNWKETMKAKRCSNSVGDECIDEDGRESYISFGCNSFNGFEEKKAWLVCDETKEGAAEVVNQSPASSGFSDLFGCSDDWDELRSIVDFAFHPFFNNP